VFETSGAAPTFAYVFRNGQPIPSFDRLIVATPFTDTSMTLTNANPAATIASIRPGDIVVLTLRAGQNALLITNTTGSTFHNIKVYSGFVGVRTVGTTSTTLDHVEVMPRPGTDRLVSTVADGISPSQIGLNNVIRLSRAIRALDDGFSPNTFVFGSVSSVTGTTVAQLQGDADTAFAAGTTLPNGSTVVFERASDGTILGSAVVVSQTTAPAIGGLSQLVVTFDRALPSGLVGSWAYPADASWRGGSLLMDRNTVQQQGWARGISLWGLVSPTLHGNYLHRTSMAGIAVMHQLFTGDWHVPPVTNLTLSDNVVDGTNISPFNHGFIELAAIESIAISDASTPMSLSPHQNFSVTGNFMGNPGRSAYWIGNVTGGTVDGNYLFNPDNHPNDSLAYPPYQALELQPAVVQASQNITVGTNPVDQASHRAFMTDPNYAELAAYAPGTTMRLNAFNLGALAGAATITLTDADGLVWPVAITASATHSIDATIPSGVGLGGAVVTLRSGSSSYFGTLFLDNQDNLSALNQSTFLISPSSLAAPAAATTLSFLVVTQAGAPYTVTTTDPFVTTSTPSAAGTGVVTIAMAANTGSARTTTIEIAGEQLTLSQAGAADPVVTTAPVNQTVASGGAATLSVTTTGAQAYQWFFDGVAIPGATASSYTIPAVAAGNAGTYTVTITNSSGSATTPGALLSLGTTAVGRMTNLSILTSLTASSSAITLGTFVAGPPGTNGTMGLLFRAAGPSLAPLLGANGLLADPQLTLYGANSTLIGYNDNWGGTTALTNVFAAVGAFSYLSAGSKDAAYYNPATPAGGYTVQVSGVAGGTGLVIAELYDSTPSSQFAGSTPRLINVSVLKTLAPGEILTAGFVISGTAAKQVLIRADGPALALPPFNLSGAMGDPAIVLYGSGSVVIASNDNWGTPVGTGASTAAQLSTAFAAVGAFPLSAGSDDAALLVTLAPGGYSAQVQGNNGTGGEVIVEIYEVK